MRPASIRLARLGPASPAVQQDLGQTSTINHLVKLFIIYSVEFSLVGLSIDSSDIRVETLRQYESVSWKYQEFGLFLPSIFLPIKTIGVGAGISSRGSEYWTRKYRPPTVKLFMALDRFGEGCSPTPRV